MVQQKHKQKFGYGLRLVLALGVALTLHVVVVLLVPQPRPSEPQRSSVIELSLRSVAPVTTNASPAVAPEPPLVSPVTPKRNANNHTPGAAYSSTSATDAQPEVIAAVPSPSQAAQPSEAVPSQVEVASATSALDSAGSETSTPSFLRRVLNAGNTGPQLDPQSVARALDKTDRYAGLVPTVRGSDALTGPPPEHEDIVAALVPHADGGYSYQGSLISAEIFADGRVLLYDPPHVRARALGIPVARLPQLFQDPRAEIRRAMHKQKKANRELAEGLSGGLLQPPDALEDVLAIAGLALSGTGGSFDITESAMRVVGEDPYASIKRCFLDQTSDLRQQLETQYNMHTERLALEALRSQLCDIWAKHDVPAAQRRQQIFALWDECAESEVGQKARDIIVAFITQQLPSGSADAYTTVEIEALNQHRSSPLRFEPYRREG